MIKKTAVNIPATLLVLCGGIVVSGLLSILFGKCLNYDLFNYHYYNAYSFVTKRLDFDYGVANIHGYFNPLPDLPFYLLVNNVSPIWVGFLLGGLQGVIVWLIFAISYILLFDTNNTRIRFGLSLLCAVTGALGPLTLSELGTDMNDNTVGIFVCLSILIVVRALSRSQHSTSLSYNCAMFVAGMVNGLAGGLKLTGLVYAVGAIAGLLALSISWKKKISSAVLFIIGHMVGFWAAAGYWMSVLWGKFKNPIFPMYNNIFKSPYYYLQNFHDNRHFPKDIVKWIFFPFYTVKNDSTVIYCDLRLPIAFVLAVVCALVVLCRFFFRNDGVKSEFGRFADEHRYILVLYFVSYLVWLKMFAVYRYMIPIEMMAPLVILILLSFLLNRRLKVMVLVLPLVFVALIVHQKIPDWGRHAWSEQYFSVQVPDIPVPEATIIIVPSDPNEIPSYLVPFFPSGIRFIRLKSWLTSPADNSRMQEELKGILNRHVGPIYSMTREPAEENKLLKKYYGLEISQSKPLTVLGPTGRFELFKIKREREGQTGI